MHGICRRIFFCRGIIGRLLWLLNLDMMSHAIPRGRHNHPKVSLYESRSLDMKSLTPFALLPWLFLSFSTLLQFGLGAKCTANGPTVKQTQVGFGNPPKFRVEVLNNCPMCPVIDVHVKCGNFDQSLVSPTLLKVVAHNDCVVRGGLPLPPLQKVSFTYSHPKYPLNPSSWDFQCE